jgi:tryptophanyl-tRNA synthetase
MSYKYVKDYLYEILQKFLGEIQKKYNLISDEDIIALLEKN